MIKYLNIDPIPFDRTADVFLDYYCIAGVGPRTFKDKTDPGLARKAKEIITDISETDYPLLVVGGNPGWDRYLTRVAHWYNIPFVLVLASTRYLDDLYVEKTLDGINHIEDAIAMIQRAKYIYSVLPGTIADRNSALLSVADEFFVWDSDVYEVTNAMQLILDTGMKYTIFNQYQELN